jgi:hypothetical protein
MYWGLDKIPRRDVNREQTFVWSHLPLDKILGYPYMKLNVALAASIAALALMTACSKQEAAAPEAAAPAAEAPVAEAPPAEAAPAPDAAAPVDGAAPADAAAPAETPPQQ